MSTTSTSGTPPTSSTAFVRPQPPFAAGAAQAGASSSAGVGGGAATPATTGTTCIGMKRKERDGGAGAGLALAQDHDALLNKHFVSTGDPSPSFLPSSSPPPEPTLASPFRGISSPSGYSSNSASPSLLVSAFSATIPPPAFSIPSDDGWLASVEAPLFRSPPVGEAEAQTSAQMDTSEQPTVKNDLVASSAPDGVDQFLQLDEWNAGQESSNALAVASSTADAKEMEQEEDDEEAQIVRNPEEELLSLRTIVSSISQGIGQLQHTLQRSQTRWHFQRIVGQLTELSNELSGQIEQTYSLYSLLQSHNLTDKCKSYSGFFSILPEECILHALSFLSARDLAAVARLNRQFKRLAEDDAVWRLLAFPRWKKARERGREKASKRQRQGWRDFFIKRRHIDKNWESGTYALRTIAGHDNQLYCIQFDDEKIVSGSEDETMKVWDIATGKCMKTLRGHTSGVWCLQFSHDRLLSGSEDSTIRIWDLKTGNCEHTLNGHKYGVWSLQFDDRTLVSGAEDQTIKMWDMHTLQCTNTLLGHKSDIWCLQFDAAQHLIVSGSGYEDRTLKIWDMRTCTCVMTLTGHMGAVNSLCVFYGSQNYPHRILSGSADQTIKVWDRRSGLCETTLEGHQGEVLCLKMADSRNPRIVSGGGSTCKTIKVWEDWYNTTNGDSKPKDRVSLSLSGHENGVWGLQYDEDKIISGSADKTIKMWDFSVSEEEVYHQEHVENEDGQAVMAAEEMETSVDGGIVDRVVVVRGKRKREDDDDL